MYKRRTVSVRFPEEPLRHNYRIAPIQQAPMAEFAGEAVRVVDFSAGGIALVDHTPGLRGRHRLIVEFASDLLIDCSARVIDERDYILRLCYVDLSNERREAMHRFILICQKDAINQIQSELNR